MLRQLRLSVVVRGGFAPARVLARASLLPAHVRVASGRRAVALAVGPLDPPAPKVNASAAPPRKSFVLALTASWSLLCFDHNLRLLWERSLADSLPRGWPPREAALLVSPTALLPGDRGLVVVAASAAPPSEGAPGEDPLEAEVAFEARAAGRTGLAGAGGDDGGVHYFALEGRHGAERWRSVGGAFHRDVDALAAGLEAQHAHVLEPGALAPKRSLGAVQCREYREAVRAALPHAWAGAGDTRLGLAHWARHGRTNSTARAGAPSPAAAPNVVVAHLRDGIEAVHLASGHSVCALLLQPGGVHVDLNGDGVLDHVAVGTEGHAHGRTARPSCVAVATSGVGTRHPLFNASVCRDAGGVPLAFAPPAVLPVRGGGARLDTAFLSSRGRRRASHPTAASTGSSAPPPGGTPPPRRCPR